MDITHLIKLRKQYRFSDQKNTEDLKKAKEHLEIGLVIAVGKLSYCKGRMTLYKRRINQLEEENQKLKNLNK